MDIICKRCHNKPALTECIRGKLCHPCALKCHPHYQHPVNFLNHGPKLTKNTTTKSMGGLSRCTADPPIRKTKVHSQLKLAQ